jgi:hypothetical protein
MTIKNDSDLNATIILDLRESKKAPGVEGLTVTRLKRNPKIKEEDRS